MSIVNVDLGPRSYPIEIGSGLLSAMPRRMLERSRPTGVAILTHPSLGRYAAPLLEGFRAESIPASIIEIPAGEKSKRLATMARIYAGLAAAGLDRKSLVVALGGGVIGDIGGFAAATYLRGIPFVQIPTTLLAQVDASIGGKTAIDLPAGKNLVGAFHQPQAVFIDVDTLATLPARELRSGLAEVIKYGIICDRRFFDRLQDQIGPILKRDSQALQEAIVRSCEIKAEIVSEDETEQGRRAILNYGHTIGHALEQATGYRRYKHGEAIAIGMVAAAVIGELAGVAEPGVLDAIRGILSRAGLPTRFPDDVPDSAILDAIQRDKKTVAGRPRFILARRVGEVVVSDNVTKEMICIALSRRRPTSCSS